MITSNLGQDTGQRQKTQASISLPAQSPPSIPTLRGSVLVLRALSPVDRGIPSMSRPFHRCKKEAQALNPRVEILNSPTACSGKRTESNNKQTGKDPQLQAVTPSRSSEVRRRTPIGSTPRLPRVTAAASAAWVATLTVPTRRSPTALVLVLVAAVVVLLVLIFVLLIWIVVLMFSTSRRFGK